jgi:hypothetical protein
MLIAQESRRRQYRFCFRGAREQLVASTSSEIDEIRRQMAEIRMHLYQDVCGVVAGAEAATDWRHYVRLYPWSALAGAVAVGYLFIPRRHARALPSPSTNGAAESHRETKKKERRGGLFGTLLSFAGPIVLRATQGYAAQYLEGFLAQNAGAFGPGAVGKTSGAPVGPGRAEPRR